VVSVGAVVRRSWRQPLKSSRPVFLTPAPRMRRSARRDRRVIDPDVDGRDAMTGHVTRSDVAPLADAPSRAGARLADRLTRRDRGVVGARRAKSRATNARGRGIRQLFFAPSRRRRVP